MQVAASANQGDFSVKIDDGAFVPQTGAGYESPVLPDGEHTLTYAFDGARGALTVFDFLTVSAGPSTPLMDRTLIVDDADDAVNFIGQWSTTPPSNSDDSDFSTKLYQDTTHWSSSVGDVLEFQFTGMRTFLPFLLYNVLIFIPL